MKYRIRMLRLIPACVAGFVFSAVSAAPSGVAPQAGADPLPAHQCSLLASWYTTTKLPNGASPFSGYINAVFKNDADGTGVNVNDVAIVIEGKFPAAGYGGWFIYPKAYEVPTGGVTFNNVVPDEGSINPYVVGNNVFASNRFYKVVLTADSVKLSDLPPNIRAMLPADDQSANINHIKFPASKGIQGGVVALFNRTYGQFDGYTRGGFHGPLNIAWPKVTTRSLKTGNTIPCGSVELARDFIQENTPWNTEGSDGLDRTALPIRGIAPWLFPSAPSSNLANSAPKPHPMLVEFFRAPPQWTGLPGGPVPNPEKDQPDYCSNYLVATLDQSRIALIRQPQVPLYAVPDTPRNGKVPSTQQVGAINFQVLGRLRSNYVPGSPETFAIGNAEITTDASGGSTILVWPTTLNRAQQARVFKMAKDNGWVLVQGNLAARSNYLTGMVIRQNGPASDFYGASYPSFTSSGGLVRTGVGCYLGPNNAGLTELGLAPEPQKNFDELSSQWAMNFKTSGPYAVQGVQCLSVLDLEKGACLDRLKTHIRATGGEYTYLGPKPWVPPYATGSPAAIK